MATELLIESKAYEYQPLSRARDEVRLIKVSPMGKQGQYPCIDIRVFELENAPPFSALSYTWGRSMYTHHVFINHHFIEVRSNLYNFLVEFQRMAHLGTYLWIDQICINQSDTIERNHQVGLMARIYRASASVIVWLGDGTKSTRKMNYYEAAKQFNGSLNPEALAVFLRDEYFGRLWIVQELLLAKIISVLIKDTWVSWESMRTVATRHRELLEVYLATDRVGIYDNPNLPPSFGTAVSLLKMTNEPTKRGWSLEEAVKEFASSNCADRRDKIYGLLGLVDEEHSLVIDYQKSVEEVWADAALALIHSFFRYAKSLELSTKLYDYGEISKSLSLHLGLSTTWSRDSSELKHVWRFLRKIWRPQTLGRFQGLSSPITAIGYDPTRNFTEGQWWFDFLGQRYYINGRYELANSPHKNGHPMISDWEVFLQREIPPQSIQATIASNSN